MTPRQRSAQVLRLHLKFAFEQFGWAGMPRAIWHAIEGPSTGCSCTFCFYSLRRRFPPGHPQHHVKYDQKLKELENRLDAVERGRFVKADLRRSS